MPEIKEILADLENAPFWLTQSKKVHRGALVLLPCLIPCHLFEKSARESRSSHHLITQRDNIQARTHDTCVDQREYMTSGRRNCSKNSKIVPYHRCARIPRLMVSVPDYGSWFQGFSNFDLGGGHLRGSDTVRAWVCTSLSPVIIWYISPVKYFIYFFQNKKYACFNPNKSSRMAVYSTWFSARFLQGCLASSVHYEVAT